MPMSCNRLHTVHGVFSFLSKDGLAHKINERQYLHVCVVVVVVAVGGVVVGVGVVGGGVVCCVLACFACVRLSW